MLFLCGRSTRGGYRRTVWSFAAASRSVRVVADKRNQFSTRESASSHCSTKLGRSNGLPVGIVCQEQNRNTVKDGTFVGCQTLLGNNWGPHACVRSWLFYVLWQGHSWRSQMLARTSTALRATVANAG